MSQHAVYRDTFNYVALLQLFVDLTTHFVFIIVIIKKIRYNTKMGFCVPKKSCILNNKNRMYFFVYKRKISKTPNFSEIVKYL